MSAPRRALPLEDDLETELFAEPVVPAHGLLEPEPSQGIRRVVAPVAVVGLMAATFGGVLLWNPGQDQAADVVVSAPPVADDISRSSAREALDTFSPTPSRATATPSTTRRSAPASRSPRPTPSQLGATPGASASPSRASATPTTLATPTRAQVAGKRWAPTALNVRALPTSGSERVAGLVEGEKVTVTTASRGRWQQVVVDGRTGWVLGAKLDDSRPASTRTSSVEGNASLGVVQGSCPSYEVERGLQADAIAVHRAICGSFPAISAFNGYRPGDMEHGNGRAIDAMVSGQAGWEVARWARANASRLHITQVIYAQQIWTTQRAGEGWRPMSDRGSATANHFDHVHITVS